jgi:crotonobetainyl-CoA:carnitine CoA-transferase CaiB-like acyl-CoA transferase
MRPLEDVRIVSVEQYGAGPFGTLHLADLGAEVIKIEDPNTGGDAGRYVPPFQEEEDSLFFETFNRNKRSLSLDLRHPGGRRVFEDLVAVSDVVFSNLRGDLPEQLKIRYADLSHLNPAIVCCSLSAFGTTGPRRAEPAYDHVLQALSGWMALTGDPGDPPTKSGLSLADYAGGFTAAIAILAALHASRRDGVGMDCDIGLFDVSLQLLTYVATWHLTQGWEPIRTRSSAHPSLVPFQMFGTADGWIVVACPKEKFWKRLAKAIGREDLAEDPRFASFRARAASVDELTLLLEETFLTSTTADWVARLVEAGVPCGRVNSVEEAMADRQTSARRMLVETDHPRFGKVRQVGSPLRIGERDTSYRRAPRRGEDEKYVLETVLDYGAERVDELRRTGALGEEPR